MLPLVVNTGKQWFEKYRKSYILLPALPDRKEKGLIVKQNTISPLLKRARATYQIDFNRSAGNKVTQSLLHIYGSAYESTESLFILKWIIEGVQNKPFTINFDCYKDKYGNILKGNLLNSIIKESKKFTDFSKLLNNAYNKKMRHLCFHNAAELK